MMAVLVVGLLFSIYVAFIGMYFYMSITGKSMTWLDALLIPVGVFFAGFTGIMIVRFIRRMLSVRRVLLFENDRIGVVTWRDELLTAKLPDQVKHMLIIGTDLTVTLQIESRYFVVDSDQFSDKDGLNDFLRRFLERYRAR